MYLQITRADGALRAAVEEADNFHRLHLESDGLADDEVRYALKRAGLGRLVDPETAVLDVDALRVLAEPATPTADWRTGWDGMLGYAADHGWLVDGGRGVQVHRH